MTRVLKIFGATGVLALLSFAGTAQAGAILVDPSTADSSVSIEIDDCFLCWSYAYHEFSDDLDDIFAYMEIGDSWTFDFFDIIVGGATYGTEAIVQATLGFTSPTTATSGTGTGSYATAYVPFIGWVAAGVLEWDQPNAIDLGDGSWLQVEFENIDEAGFGNRTTVSATVSRYGNSVAVPEPATLGLLGIGLLGIGIASRRRVGA